MTMTIFTFLGEQLRRLRKTRGLSQSALAERLGRDPARISELERNLLDSRLGRDRLTLFADICDALDVVPLLVPRARAAEVHQLIAGEDAQIDFHQPIKSMFNELFIDLTDAHEGEG